MPKNKLAFTSVVTAAGLLLSTLSSSASAAEENTTPTEASSLEAPHSDESRQFAFGHLSTQQLSWSTEVSLAFTKIQEGYPDDFAYAGIDEDYLGAYVAFKGQVPDVAAQIAKQLPNVRILSAVGFNNSEVHAYATALAKGSMSAQPDFGYSVAVAPMPEKRTFNVNIGAVANESEQGLVTETIEPQEIEELELEIEHFAQETPPLADFTVVVEGGTEVNTDQEAEDGGRQLAGVCTGAFPMRRNGGIELGIFTAGHCPGTGSYGSTANMFNGTYPNSLRTSNASQTGGDFRWNHSRYVPSGYTNLGAGGRKKFTQSGIAYNGNIACKYGKTTGHACDRVAASGVVVNIYIPEGRARYDVGPLICTGQHITDDGDSGGPWYLQGSWVGVGIHSGFYSGSSCFSYLTNAMRALNAHLWVG